MIADWNVFDRFLWACWSEEDFLPTSDEERIGETPSPTASDLDSSCQGISKESLEIEVTSAAEQVSERPKQMRSRPLAKRTSIVHLDPKIKSRLYELACKSSLKNIEIANQINKEFYNLFIGTDEQKIAKVSNIKKRYLNNPLKLAKFFAESN